MGLFDALEDAVTSVYDAGSSAVSAVGGAATHLYNDPVGAIGSVGVYAYNGLDQATSRDGWFTEIAEQIPGVGLVPSLVHYAAGNDQYAIATLGYQANAITTWAGSAAGFAVGGPAGAVAGGALGGAFGTWAEASIGSAYVTDPYVRGQMASASATDIALGGAIGGISGSYKGVGSTWSKGVKAQGGPMATFMNGAAGAERGWFGRKAATMVGERGYTQGLRAFGDPMKGYLRDIQISDNEFLDPAWNSASQWVTNAYGDASNWMSPSYPAQSSFADDGWDSGPQYDVFGNTINAYDPNAFVPDYMDPYRNGDGYFGGDDYVDPGQIPLDQWWGQPESPAVWQATTMNQWYPDYGTQMVEAYPQYDPYNTQYDEYGNPIGMADGYEYDSGDDSYDQSFDFDDDDGFDGGDTFDSGSDDDGDEYEYGDSGDDDDDGGDDDFDDVVDDYEY
jgi:hypothetical protein